MSAIETRALSDPAGDVNEDCALAGPTWGVVVDGATGIDAADLAPADTDAAWFAQSLGRELAHRLASPAPLASLLAESVSRLRHEYERLPGAQAVAREALPTGSVALARVRRDVLELYSLGDCTVIVGHEDGRLEVLRDDRVPRLDALAVRRMVALAAQRGVTPREARPWVDAQLRAQRARRNRPGGYGVADLAGDGIGLGLATTRPWPQLRFVALLTDGYAAAVDGVALLPDHRALMAAVAARGPERVLAELRRAEAADPDLVAHPRLKRSDDASIVLLAKPGRRIP